MSAMPFADLPALATHLREELQNKKFILLYPFNSALLPSASPPMPPA